MCRGILLTKRCFTNYNFVIDEITNNLYTTTTKFIKIENILSETVVNSKSESFSFEHSLKCDLYHTEAIYGIS